MWNHVAISGEIKKYEKFWKNCAVTLGEEFKNFMIFYPWMVSHVLDSANCVKKNILGAILELRPEIRTTLFEGAKSAVLATDNGMKKSLNNMVKANIDFCDDEGCHVFDMVKKGEEAKVIEAGVSP
jgi:hypothetical protein